MVGAVRPSLSGLTGSLLTVAGVAGTLAAQLGSAWHINASYLWTLIIVLGI